MAVKAIGTQGAKLKYAVETTAGTMPSSFTAIPGVVSIPGIANAPEVLDATELDETVQKWGIPGLLGIANAIGVTFNATDANETAWDTMVTAFATGAASNKATWFEVYIPNHKGYFFTGTPSALSFNGAEVDKVHQNIGYITPSSAVTRDTAI